MASSSKSVKFGELPGKRGEGNSRGRSAREMRIMNGREALHLPGFIPIEMFEEH